MMSHAEIEELLGAYALDAVEPDEARAVEAHLAECPRCRAEVAAHREVATLLTSGTSEGVPDGVWDRIAADLGDTPPPVPLTARFGQDQAATPPGRSRSARVLGGLAAAAAIVLLAVMGGVLINQRAELDDLRDEVEAARSDPLLDLLAEPETQVVNLHSEDGVTEARAIVGGQGDSVLLAGDLPALDADRTYQLWGLPDGRESMVSLGVLGANPHRSEFHVQGRISTLAITLEPGGGSTQPSSEPLVTGAIT